ncbi:MAG: DUF6029 family protein [Saprospiraceae bacterium]
MLLTKQNGLLLILFTCIYTLGFSQSNNQGSFSGSLETNANFFQEDSLIEAFNTPQYDHQLFGSEVWLDLKYSNFGFDIGARFDFFNNSNLLQPNESYTDQGVGRWYIHKKVNKLDITAGYIYDQIGSGIIFRAFEERPLLIDNALVGLKLTYDLTPDWKVKVLTGRQKNLLDLYDSVIKGASIDGYVRFDSSGVSLAPGFGMMSKTIDDETMGRVLTNLSSYRDPYRIPAKYNSYAFSVYNTLTAGPFTWYVEGAYKTNEVIWDPTFVWSRIEQSTGLEIPLLGKYDFRDGNIIYTSLGYAGNGLGISLEGKRTESFSFRVNPFENTNRGAINFIPPTTRVNTYRLNARYSPATQELGEQAVQLDVRYSPSRKLGFLVNFSNITTLDNDLLYREIYTEVTYKYKRKWQLISGIQWQNYNQNIYEGKTGVDILETVTPYAEFLYKLSRKKSLRFELQYMFAAPGISTNPETNEKYTNRDFGDWIFGQVEIGLAPHWIITIADMYNVSPYKKNLQPGEKAEDLHYPTLGVVYTHRSNRFEVRYVKQVEGIVCAGGICRLEPAFSGLKMSVRSTF